MKLINFIQKIALFLLLLATSGTITNFYATHVSIVSNQELCNKMLVLEEERETYLYGEVSNMFPDCTLDQVDEIAIMIINTGLAVIFNLRLQFPEVDVTFERFNEICNRIYSLRIKNDLNPALERAFFVNNELCVRLISGDLRAIQFYNSMNAVVSSIISKPLNCTRNVSDEQLIITIMNFINEDNIKTENW